MKKASKKFLVCIAVAMMIFAFATTAFATDDVDNLNPSIPSSAKSYSATKCAVGFTTTRYLSKPSSGFPGKIRVSNNYVLWDDYDDYDMYQVVKPKDDNGNYLRSNWGMVYTGYNDNVQYSDLDMTASSTTKKVYLRIANPSSIGSSNSKYSINYETGEPIKNMKTAGKFWFS